MKNVVLFSDRNDIKKCITFLKKKNIPILGLISNTLSQDEFDIPILSSLQQADYSQSLLVSYYYSSLIPSEVFTVFNMAVNFHPAPMPYYRGVKCGVFAILNKEEKFGVTCHKINTKFDDGEIIGQLEFMLDENETGYSLYNKSKNTLYDLFTKYIANKFLNDTYTLFDIIPNMSYKAKQNSYYSNKDFEKLKCLDGKDILSKEVYTILKALWTPAYVDAYIKNNLGKRIYISLKDSNMH